MLNYKEFMEALKQTIYSQTGWKSDCMGSLTDEGPTSDTARKLNFIRYRKLQLKTFCNWPLYLLFLTEPW